MERSYYHQLTDRSLALQLLDPEESLLVLESPQVELLPLLNAAFEVRKKHFGKEVRVHVINNAQNGFCPEDCHYCAQAKSSQADIEEYPLKSETEILAEAKNAYEKGAHRYCMVFAGRGPSMGRVEQLAGLIRKIKETYPIEVCVSAGLLDDAKATVLKQAGLDRLNHNLNTSESNYPNICTTHTYQDRLRTLQSARNAGIPLCSGMILGMHESHKEVVEVAMTLSKLKVESIPVNLLIGIEGNVLKKPSALTPEYCLRVLCLFRFLNPKAEIRVAAGRELHLRQMEVMALYPANSLFMDGYLNTKGSNQSRTLKMIEEAGFTISSDYPIEQLLNKNDQFGEALPQEMPLVSGDLKGVQELRPFRP